MEKIILKCTCHKIDHALFQEHTYIIYRREKEKKRNREGGRKERNDGRVMEWVRPVAGWQRALPPLE